jgi:RNA polymerase sigma factor (sigma-70 family)
LRFALISAIKFAISVLALAAACLAQEGLTVDNRHKERVSTPEAEKIYFSACSVVREEFDVKRPILPRVKLVLGASKNGVLWCSFSTWIYRIVTNLCPDHLRKNRNRRENSAIEVNVEGEEYDLLNQLSDDRSANNPERRLLNRELSAHILCAFQRLTPRERMVFESKHLQGLRLRTVGQILNTSEASVKTSLFRAAQKLRFQLDGLTTGKKSSMKQRCDTRGVNQSAI